MKAADFGKVAVLMGGRSAEREVSLKSGNAVLAALQQRGVDAHGIDVSADIINVLQREKFDRVFIVLHGRGGEDGVIQGALQTLGLPYTGSGVLGSALSMDKILTKKIWLATGLPTLPFEVLHDSSDFLQVAERIGLPLAVKPVHEGSSIGATKLEQADQLEEAYKKAAQFDSEVMVEPWITGKEYTATILGNDALPLIRLETPRTFYDYEAKYQLDTTRYFCPCGLDAEKEKELQDMALKAFQVLGASGWGRVDIICDDKGDPWLLENNTVPGMTDHSLVPMAAKAAGIEFDELVWRILELTMA